MKVRFDQLAINVKEKKKPTEEDRRHYIGLEHLDSGSLTVSRWGADVAPKGEKLLMKKGDVLFGKRRAYQKKVAIAPFDGIFSAHGMVLRPNEKIIDKAFFPLFISSDYFLDAAIALSVGSLSPTINWKDLARLEFELPSLEKQSELAEVLWAIEDTRAAYQRLEQETDELVKARFIEMFGDLTTDTVVSSCFTLQDLLDKKWITYHLDGNHGSDYPRSHEFLPDGVPYISANCIVNGKIDFSRGKYVSEERAARFRKGVACDRDVLFAHNATVGPVAVLKTDYPKVILGTSLTSYRCDEQYILPEYLKAYMENPIFVRQYESDMQQTTRSQVPITKQRMYQFIIPKIERQKTFSVFVQQTEKSKLAVQSILEKTAAMKAAVMWEWLK